MNTAEMIEQIKRHLDDEQWDAAIEACNALLREEAGNVWGLVCQGVACAGKGDYDQAMSSCDKAIELAPRQAIVYRLRGLCRFSTDEYDDAVTDFSKAIELAPAVANAYSGRGACRLWQQEYDGAIADFGEAVRLNPADAFAYKNRGDAYCRQREYDKAIADYNETIRLNPLYDSVYSERGNAHFAKGEYKKAIFDYDAAIYINERKLTEKFAVFEMELVAGRLTIAEISSGKGRMPLVVIEKKHETVVRKIEVLKEAMETRRRITRLVKRLYACTSIKLIFTTELLLDLVFNSLTWLRTILILHYHGKALKKLNSDLFRIRKRLIKEKDGAVSGILGKDGFADPHTDTSDNKRRADDQELLRNIILKDIRLRLCRSLTLDGLDEDGR